MAYNRSLVSVSNSQEAIKALLRKQGVSAVMFSERFRPWKIVIDFGYKTDNGGARVVRYEVQINDPEPYTKRGRAKADNIIEREREWSKRQAMRVLYYYLKSAFEAVEHGLIKRDEVFMPFFLLETGQLLKDKIELDISAGRLALPGVAE